MMARRTGQQGSARSRMAVVMVVFGVLSLLGAVWADAANNDVLASAATAVTLACTVWLVVDVARRWQRDRVHRA
ncbi:hypothetical protein ACWD4N_45015 [Streptomyces sp. NPDC002586]